MPTGRPLGGAAAVKGCTVRPPADSLGLSAAFSGRLQSWFVFSEEEEEGSLTKSHRGQNEDGPQAFAAGHLGGGVFRL